MSAQQLAAAFGAALVPYALASLGGAVTERSGVPHIALEACMAGGAFAAIALEVAGSGSAIGSLAAAAAGATIGMMHAFATQRLRVDGIVSGFALNLGVLAATRVALRMLYGSSSNSPSTTAQNGAELWPFALFALVLCIGLPWWLARSRFGLQLRSAGDSPAAVRAVGLSVARIRSRAVVLGSALAGLGGGALGSALHQFQAGMIGGRGFLALALVILAGWDFRRVLLSACGLAAIEVAGVHIQARYGAPPELLAALPYVGALLVLGLVRGRRSAAPAGMGDFGESAT